MEQSKFQDISAQSTNIFATVTLDDTETWVIYLYLGRLLICLPEAHLCYLVKCQQRK